MIFRRLKGQFKGILVLMLGLSFLTVCEIKQPMEDGAVAPFLSELTAPKKLYLLSDVLYSVSVHAEDPQGWTNLQRVGISVYPETGSEALLDDVMADDGQSGDVIPRDNRFHYHLSMDFAQDEAGRYRVEVVAEDADGNVSNPVVDTVEVVNEAMNLPPTLFDPMLPDTLTQEARGDVFLGIRVEDPQGGEDIDSTVFQIYPPNHPVSTFQNFLADDGTGGDASPGDSLYSFSGDLSDVVLKEGEYAVRFQAFDKGGLKSSALVASFYASIPNEPPILSNIMAPDTLSRSTAGTFLLAVQADDPQGPDDIKRVYFNSTLPDGSPSTGNPFVMFDDGTSGDVEAGDGTYSLEVTISSSSALGRYQFDFIAEDFSDALSAALTHFIQVIE